ncbi:hypothetical protein CF149_04646 [Pseudomonas psychrophila]|jgi:hypothetical protein|uniref:Uncharacterized protein n=1 Tax=Pseudomonas psychrophila TaxID=122355 RepID=A0ABY0W4V7_9PSED|nr:hypothetical protein CF149_04646 [Pseudomonas psychrophila]KMN00119.1 hypothetical protein TU76_12680 [Pseudomonas psychrophila]KOX67115.1 hypothetical protein AA303_00310 [Pseudomonas psychrophila]SDU72826.1 hypothetical protein SAMN04490201_4359 [Pseudomonas psychrophila]
MGRTFRTLTGHLLAISTESFPSPLPRALDLIVQFALHQKAIIANCNQILLNTYLNQLFYKGF